VVGAVVKMVMHGNINISNLTPMNQKKTRWVFGYIIGASKYSAEQEAIFKATQVPGREERWRMIVADSLSTRMTAEGDTNSKNPNEEKENITLHWVPGHMGIPGNKTADEKAKKR
jgi:hypothetical protein